MTHEVQHALALVGYQAAHLLQRWRTSAFKSNSRWDLLYDFFQAQPFAIDVEGVQFFVQRVGRDGDNMQAAIHDSRGDALLSRQAPHERTLQHEGAIGIFGSIAAVSV